MASNRKTNPRDDEVLNAAMEALQAGRLDEAEERARTATEANPHSEMAWRILAAAVKRQNRSQDFAVILQEAIACNPRSASLFAMLATILRAMQRPNDAETAARHALMLEPGQPEASLLMGNLLAERGLLVEAKAEFASGAAASPLEPRFALQLGRIALLQGQIADATHAFERAATLGRKRITNAGGLQDDTEIYLDAVTHAGRLLFQQGKRIEALNYLDEAVRLADDETTRALFAECVCGLTFVKHFPPLKPLLVRALNEAWVDPADLIRPGIQQLLLDDEFASAMKECVNIARKGDDVLRSPAISRIASDPLLIALMCTGIVNSEELEHLFAVLRHAFLAACVGGDTDVATQHLEFAAVLANQCFFTEYAYAVSEVESRKVDALQAEILKNASPIALAALACYRALNTIDAAGACPSRDWDTVLQPVIQRQLIEPQREAELRKTISAITPITDKISHAVRVQYEENPFPRWIRSRARKERKTLASWIRSSFSDLPPPADIYGSSATPLELLVAGCGTGQEVVASATRFVNSQVLAVDLSLTSLAYAVRQTEEIGLKNITYAQADILELDGLGRQFDVVECGGVLHHLADPVAGWRILAGLTKPGGYMLMALYSDLGRRDLDPAIAFAKEGGYGTSPNELRRFRADVLALPAGHPVRGIAAQRDDFYNLSMLRDLVFNVQEYRFTIPAIRMALDQLGLQFGGFGVGPEVVEKFRQSFGASADLRSLFQWEKFEQDYPGTFSAMYHFLALMPAH